MRCGQYQDLFDPTIEVILKGCNLSFDGHNVQIYGFLEIIGNFPFAICGLFVKEPLPKSL
jgi:hypothetical protein